MFLLAGMLFFPTILNPTIPLEPFPSISVTQDPKSFLHALNSSDKIKTLHDFYQNVININENSTSCDAGLLD